MPSWNLAVVRTYQDALQEIEVEVGERLATVTNGRVAPALEDLRIGSARHMRAAVLFFDIRNFTQRTGSAELSGLLSTLMMLNCVIPMTMRVLFRHGAWVEKNTGDGLMAILGAEEPDTNAAEAALSSASEIFYVLTNLVNPVLARRGIDPVQARIGIDLGSMLIARIGLPTGQSAHPRNTLTAVGPAANLACKFQAMAGTDEIWCGDLIKQNAPEWRQRLMDRVTPLDWAWEYQPAGGTYDVWHYDAVRRAPTE